MFTPKDLDRVADRQERQGAKIFFSALKTVYKEMADQYARGYEPKPREAVIKNAVIAYHSRVQYEMADWQLNDLQKRNPVKALQVGVHERILGKIKTWIALNTGTSIKSINETTLLHVQKMIADGQVQGLGAKKIAKNIEAEAKGKFTAYRSLVISRTEGTRAASQGAKFGAEQWESITGQQKWKSWSAAADSRTRDQHLEMIGTPPIPGNEDFIVGGYAMDGPGDPKGGKANIINCRCRRYYMSERMARKIIAESGGKPVPEQPTYTAQPVSKPIPTKPVKPAKPQPIVSKPVPDNVDDELDAAIKLFEENGKGKDAIYAVRHMEAYKDSLREAERASIFSYTTSNYRLLNEYNRGRLQDHYLADFFKAHTKVLNAALDKFPEKHVGYVYRGTEQYDRLGNDIVAKYEEAFRQGTPLTEEAFMSTSYEQSRQFGGNVNFVVYSKTGSKVERLSDISTENEVLFKAGQQFNVTGITKYGSTVKIEMIEL